jgi:hypothetical protein
MSVNNEIKRMLSLLESELGNVKPLITEEGEEPVEASKGPIERSVSIGCWTKKGYTTDGVILTLGKDYVYAFSKIAPGVQAGDKFMKVTTADGTNLYVFEKPTTDPTALSANPNAYLAVVRNKDVKSSKDPNLSYLSAHGWYCDGFTATQNAASQETQMTTDQTNAVRTLAGTDYVKRSRGQIYTTKPLGDDVNYQTIDLATGKNTKGEQVIPAQDMELIKGYNFTPGKFFVYLAAGTQTKYTNVPVAVEAALKQMGYTAQEPSDVLSTEAQNPTTVTELCNTLMVGQCNPTILKYANDNPNQTLWPMNQEQIAAAKEAGITVFNQADLESGLTSNKRKLKLAGKEFSSKFADKRSCQTGIDILSMCSKYNDDKRCEAYMNQLSTSGAITFPQGMNTYALKIAGLKQLVGNDCIVGDVKIPNRYEPMLAQLQSSSGKFGLVAPTVKTQTQQTTNARGGNLEESLNNSIKSVITEAINKNNNKNLDSIIKKNLRKYIG